MATAAVAVLVAVPLLARQSPEAPLGYGGERMRVRAVSTAEGVKAAPVVLEDEQGNTIIWVVDQVPAQDTPDSDMGGGDTSTPGPDDGPSPTPDSSGDSSSDSSSDSSGDSGGGESASRPRPGGAVKPAGPQPSRPKGGAL
jgi:hypothetical protein